MPAHPRKMKFRKAFTSLMAAGLTAASVITASAATDSVQSVIDPLADCSLTIYKLKTTSSTVRQGTGFEDMSVTEEGMSGIVFSAMKVASIETAAKDGKIETFYTDLDPGFAELLETAEVENEPIVIGNKEYYRSAQLSDALEAMNSVGGTVPGEVQINNYVRTNGTELPVTDEYGMTFLDVDAADQGLYLLAETDYSAYSNAEGALAAEVVYKPSSPFFVSLPMTGQISVEDENTSVEANTYWMYNVTVYPKNQTVSVPKYIVDPADGDTLEQSEDMEFGKDFEEIITASAPAVTGASNAYEKYVITDTMDAGLSFRELLSVRIGSEISSPTALSAFESFSVLTADTDYVFALNEETNSFTVTFLSAGLEKLNALSMNAQVVVDFKVYLNENAESGNGVPNENTPSLTWKNLSTLETSVDGNKPKVYAYGIHLTKTGVEDASNVSFAVRQNGEMMKFTEEEAGVYHVSEDEDEDAAEEISPASDGSLMIRGLDEGVYIFEETKTEHGHDLLSTRFSVTLSGTDPEDGMLESAVLAAVDLEGNEISDSVNAQIELGTAQITVANNESIVLHTGGTGTTWIYLCGTAAAAMAAVLLAVRRKMA